MKRRVFANRVEAGRELAEAVAALAPEDPVVLALPRGGVPVAAAVAQRLGAPLDVVLARKLGAPGRPELALGAVVDGDAPTVVLNEDIVRELEVTEAFIQSEVETELATIEERRRLYVGERPPQSVEGRCAIIVDDGLATGATMRAAVRAVSRKGPARVIVAVPVGARDTVRSLRHEVDEIVCLEVPGRFGSVGSFYRDFSQVDDETVVEILTQASSRRLT